MNDAIVYFANSSGIGLTDHFSRIVVDLYKRFQGGDHHFYVASTPNEQNVGLWDYVKSAIPSDRLLIYESESDLQDMLDLVFESHSSFAFQLHGFYHMKLYSRIKKRHPGNKTASIVKVHSFQHGKRYRRIIHSIIRTFFVFYWGIDKIVFLTPWAMGKFKGMRFLKKHNKALHIPFYIKPLEIVTPVPGADIDKEVFADFENDKTIKLVYFANYFKHKGHHYIIDAFSDFAKSNKVNQIKIYCFGSGERLEFLKNRVDSLGLSDNICLENRIDRKYVAWLLSKSQGAIVASESETFGHNFLEPLMMGVPVIGTRVGCGEYLIQDYITGLGVEPNRKSFPKAFETFFDVIIRDKNIPGPVVNNY